LPDSGVGAAVLADIPFQVEQDIPIWAHKSYPDPAMLSAADGALSQLRRWARQFHASRESTVRQRRRESCANGSMPVEPDPGAIIGGGYELVEKAGRGGMADVWRSLVCGDFGFRRVMAIKQMHTALAEQDGYVNMFVEEARLGAL